MRRIGRLGVLVVALSGAARGAPDAAAPGAASGALPLRSGGPTLIVGMGARIESVDPDSGRVIGSIAPVAVSNFTWRRFLRRGRFLLAEGNTDWVQEPVAWHRTRGLVLLDETGRVRWAETHAVTRNRTHQAVFLDGEGNVAFDRLDKPLLIKADGTRVDIAYPPAGPVLHAPADVLPLKPLCAEKVERWLWVSSRVGGDEAPTSIAKQLLLRPTLGERQIALVQVTDVAPEDDAYVSEVKTVARIPLPAACRGARHWVSPTMSWRHWIIDCSPLSDELASSPRWTKFVIDVEARRLRRLTPPPSDQSDVPRDSRVPDDIDATVMPDGTIVASVCNGCRAQVYTSASGGDWKRSNVDPGFGQAVAPEPVCGRLTLQRKLPAANHHCSGPPGPATYVRRPDGAWLSLSYTIAAPQSGSCSSDAEVVAFVSGAALTTARLDREERKAVRAGVSQDAPVAWLP